MSMISAAPLKIAVGNVSAQGLNQAVILPGGLHGFMPQFYGVLNNSAMAFTSNVATEYVSHALITNGNGGSNWCYVQQAYIQQSPPYKVGNVDAWGHFVWIKRRISTGEIIAVYEAPDPCYAYNGNPSNEKDSAGRIAQVPHPFPAHEIGPDDFISLYDNDPADFDFKIEMIDMRGFDFSLLGNKSLIKEIPLIVNPAGRDMKPDLDLPDAVSAAFAKVSIKKKDA